MYANIYPFKDCTLNLRPSMKKARVTENQIISIISQQEKGITLAEHVGLSIKAKADCLSIIFFKNKQVCYFSIIQ
jgi:hypothetical protein